MFKVVVGVGLGGGGGREDAWEAAGQEGFASRDTAADYTEACFDGHYGVKGCSFVCLSGGRS